MADFEAATPSALLAPAGTPADVVKVLNAALNKALADPAVHKRLVELGSDPRPMDPAQFAAYLRAEDGKLKALVKAGLLKGG